ncbi:hypothetical protein TruAng_007431 [Truncatella angustata]|nr:hypothetical protein TruAng_007431 [Truncatella angustata]
MRVKPDAPKPPSKKEYSWHFWAISLLASVESTVASTALPSISGTLHAGGNYVLPVLNHENRSTAFLPLFGQMADIFGRRWLTICTVATFALGSSICGGASTTAILLCGRAVQGVGGGGINLMIEMIVCDLVPLRDRGRFMGVIFAIFTIGTSLSPFIGGAIIENTTWRCVFYINLPISGVSLSLLGTFVHANYQHGPSTLDRLRRIDYTGNLILVGSVTAALIACDLLLICMAGPNSVDPWLFWDGRPMVPKHLFNNRTSAAALFLTLIHALHLALYVVFQIIAGVGPGLALTTLLPATQAALSEKYTASSTAVWSLVRSFGTVWGVSVPAAVFNRRADTLAYRVTDPAIRAMIANGQAFSHASSELPNTFSNTTRDQVVEVYNESLHTVWIVAVIITGVSIFVVFAEKEIELRDNLDTDYGFQDSAKPTSSQENNS